MAGSSTTTEQPVLHVVVIGFHHKKGCQVEYSYPPLIPGGEVDSHEVPLEWKHLASLAVPDGAHNYTKDTIYFHLPAREGSPRTVYGVACYRQMDSKDLVNRPADITRSTVQKSVCVLSYLPLYGLIQAKLELITHAYFQELDFSKVDLLRETYRNLNLSLTESLLDGGSQVYLGMSSRSVVLQFKHKIVLLFKLILLERRVLFTGTPVELMSNLLLSVLSLFPGMIEHGLTEAGTVGLHKQISPNMKSAMIGDESEEYLEIRYSGDASGLDSSPDIELKLFCGQGPGTSQEPESPIMERGDVLENSVPSNETSEHSAHSQTHDSLDGKPSKKLKDSMNEKLKMCDSLTYVENHFGDTDSSEDKSSAAQPKLEIDAAGQSHSHDETSSHNLSPTEAHHVLLGDSSMVMMGVTQLEAVQIGKSIPGTESVINIEEYSVDTEGELTGSVSERATVGSLPGDLSISLEESDFGGLKKTDSVEELDSPESISQIDREDCFSWEEDRLLLAIDHDLDSSKENHRLGSGSKDETNDLAASFTDISLTERSDASVKSVSSLGSDKKIEDLATEYAAIKTSAEEIKDTSNAGSTASPGVKASVIKNKLSTAFSGLSIKQKFKGRGGQKESSPPALPAQEATHLPTLPVLTQDDLGFPLAIFTKGSVCHPYLSLQYFDLMNDVNVRSFVIGATNILFRQKRHLTDVVVEVNEGRIEMHDRELQKQLALTTADLRFADILVKAVTEQAEGLYLDGTEWEGGDEWLRAQFRLYLESMLSCTLTEDPRQMEDYGMTFLAAWKTTHNYRVWASSPHPGMDDIPAQHPCQGNLGIADIRVRLAHTMQSTERGKKLNAAVSQTSKYMVQTGKAVGGAITQAKSSLSSWFSNLTSDWKQQQEKNPSPVSSPARSHRPSQPQVHTAGSKSSSETSQKDQ